MPQFMPSKPTDRRHILSDAASDAAGCALAGHGLAWLARLALALPTEAPRRWARCRRASSCGPSSCGRCIDICAADVCRFTHRFDPRVDGMPAPEDDTITSPHRGLSYREEPSCDRFIS